MKIKTEIKKASIILFSMMLICFVWIYTFNRFNLAFSLTAFLKIHNENPIIFLLEAVILILSLFYYFIQKRDRKIIEEQSAIIEENQKMNQLHISYAKKIGEGDFKFNIAADKENDMLAYTLALMRRNLLAKQQKEAEYAWISRGKEMISDVLRVHTDIDELMYDVLVKIIEYSNLVQGAVYLYDEETKLLINKATYAFNRKKYKESTVKIGEGLVGQAAFEMATIYIKEIPSDYVTISSGIIEDKKPGAILIIPLKIENKLYGVFEFAAIEDEISEKIIGLVEKVSVNIARTIFNLQVNLKTQKLLDAAQVMTEELQENEERLERNAEEMKITHEKIEEANQNLELQIKLVENSKQRLHSLLENASEVISIYHPDGTVFYESPSVRNILGYRADEIVGTDGFARILDTDSDHVHIVFARLLKNQEESQIFEFQYVKKDGSIVWLEAIGRNLLSNIAIHGIIFNTRDISERKQVEKEQRRRGQMQSLSENSPDMIMRLTPDGTFYYVNPVVEKYTFIPPAKFNQKNINELSLEPEMQNLLYDVIQTVTETNQKLRKEFEIESLFEKKQMLVNAIPEFNELKEFESILVIAHDNTEQKKIEIEIREKNKNITESINYARRLQTSIIPTTSYIQEYIEKCFIYYRPKDILSGDFPWFFKKGNDLYIATVDCTGHGVPGALLSVVGYFLLNNIVGHEKNYTPGEILKLLHQGVKHTLKQDADKPGSHDGMDISLCKINLENKLLEYAGAHRPLYLLQGIQFTEIKGDRKPIGGAYTYKKASDEFTTHAINVNSGDKIFFFSDGLPDQYGGPTQNKYSTARIKEEIVKNAEFSMEQYHDFFHATFTEWKGILTQIDDVLMIGIEF